MGNKHGLAAQIHLNVDFGAKISVGGIATV